MDCTQFKYSHMQTYKTKNRIDERKTKLNAKIAFQTCDLFEYVRNALAHWLIYCPARIIQEHVSLSLGTGYSSYCRTIYFAFLFSVFFFHMNLVFYFVLFSRSFIIHVCNFNEPIAPTINHIANRHTTQKKK